MPGAHEAVQRRLQLATLWFRDDQLDEVLAERVLARPTENLFGLRIPVQDAAGLVDLDEGIERGLDDAARQLLDIAHQCVAGVPGRRVSQDGLGTGAHLNQDSPGIDNKDQILGSIKDAAALLDLLAQRVLGLPAFGNVADGFRCTDDRARRRPDRGYAERDLHRAAVLARALRFVLLDRFTPADPAQDVMHLRDPVGRNDQIDALADRFRRGISEQPFGGRIPAGDRAVEGLGDDGVVGGFHGGTEKALARGVMVARRLGPAMFLDLALQRLGLGVGLLQHPRKRPCQHAGLSARIDGNGGRVAFADALDRRRQLTDRPGQRAGNEHGQRGRSQHRDQSDQHGRVLDGRRRRHEHRVRECFDDTDPFAAGQQGRSERHPARLPGLILDDPGHALPCADRGGQIREVALPVARLVEQRGEFAGGIGVDEIVAAAVDDIDRLAHLHR